MLQRLCLLGVTGAVALGGGPQIAPPNCAVKPDVSGHVFIPPEMTHINASAFAFCTTLIHVTIGPTVRIPIVPTLDGSNRHRFVRIT